MGKIVPLFQRIIQWSVVSPFTKHYVDNEVVMLWGKQYQILTSTNWSVVSPFTKHNVDNEVLMLWEKQYHTIKELPTGVQCHLSQNIRLIIKCLCYGKNSHKLLKNNQLECSAPFTKHKVDNEVLMLWGKQSHTIKELPTGVQCPLSQNITLIMKWLCYGKNSPKLLKNNQLECSVPFHKT